MIVLLAYCCSCFVIVTVVVVVVAFAFHRFNELLLFLLIVFECV